ncbi:MAG: hypothetical protein HDR04_06050 [Lachnospiraceae bacterium]|nr:hypothetical protein [Lachnospiraceae bacterium]
MIKKISKALFLCGVVVVLTACGQEAAPAGDLAQTIKIGTGRSGNDGKVDDKEDRETEAPDQENTKEGEGVFCFVYEGATLIPGELVDHSVLPECSDVAEVPSCAFDGNDNIYNFDVFELTAYLDGDEERIYSVYFMDPNLPTTEGLCLGDTVDDMRSLYGEGYEEEGTAFTYTRGKTLLIIIAKNDIVVSIEYRLDR